jgi:Caspase domain
MNRRITEATFQATWQTALQTAVRGVLAGIAASLVVIGLGGAARGNPRLALVIGNNLGLDADPPLRYAESDAVEMARALVETGVVKQGAVYRLLGANASAAARAFETIAERAGSDGDVLLFFSGHGDAQGAHLAGTTWTWSDIRRSMRQAHVNLLVGFFDACSSGALVSAKGFVRGPPLAVSVAPLGPSGRFLVTSSGANEFSYESVELGGSPFSFHLRSAIRGAADGDRDGQLTLSEVYDYLYARTVASTLNAPFGAQRPVQSIELRGVGAWVVATLGGLTRLSRGQTPGGSCFVLDRTASRLLVEIGTAADAAVALPSGTYIVKCTNDDELRTATVSLSGTAASIESARFTSSPRLYALAKGTGASAPRGHQVAIAGGILLGVPGKGGTGVSAAVRYRLDLGDFALHLQATGFSSPRAVVPALGFSVRLPWSGNRTLASDIGLLVAARLGETAASAAAGVGPFLQVHRTVTAGLGVVGRLEFLSFYPVGSQATATGSFLFTLGLAIDLGSPTDGSQDGSSGELTVVP